MLGNQESNSGRKDKQASVRRLVRSTLVISIAVAFALVVAKALMHGVWQSNFGKWEPGNVYTMVMGSPVPFGVTNLKASGRRYVDKRWVWITLHASPSVMDTLLSRGRRITAPESYYAVDQQLPVDPKYNAQDMQAVMWDGIRSRPNLDIVRFGSAYGRTQFLDWVFVDKKTGTVFIKAFGQ